MQLSVSSKVFKIPYSIEQSCDQIAIKIQKKQN